MDAGYDGATLLDSAGESVGTVERSFVDDNGALRFLEVKYGTLFTQHRLVPADGVEETDDGVKVLFTKDVIEESPSVSSDDTIEGDALQQVREYYASEQAPMETTSTETIRTEPDPAELEAVAESDDRSRPANDVPTSTEGTTDTRSPAPLGEIRDLGDAIEIPVVEEEIVKRPVVREVLRVRKTQTIEDKVVGEDVRRESVEVVPSTSGLVSEDATEDDE